MHHTYILHIQTCITLKNTHLTSCSRGSFIKYVTLFWTNFDPPVTLCHTSRDSLKYVTHFGPLPIFGSTCIHTYVFTVGFVLVRGGFCSGSFCPGHFVWKVLSGVVFVHLS